MTLIEQRTWVCECDACHAQTTITAPYYPRETELPLRWTQLPENPPRREKHLCPACSKETTDE